MSKPKINLLDLIDVSLITKGVVNSYASNIDSYKELLQNALDELINQYHQNSGIRGNLEVHLNRSGKLPELSVIISPGHYVDVIGSVLPGSRTSHDKATVKGTTGGMSFGLSSQYFNSDRFSVETTYLDENNNSVTKTYQKDGVRELFENHAPIEDLLPELISSEKNKYDKTGSTTKMSSETYDFRTYPLSFKPNNHTLTQYNNLDELEYFLKTETPIGYTYNLFGKGVGWQNDFVDNTDVKITFTDEMGNCESKSTRLGYKSPLTELDEHSIITSEEFAVLKRKIKKGKYNLYSGSVYTFEYSKYILGLGTLRFFGISGDRSVQKKMYPYFNEVGSDAAIRAKDLDEVGGVILSIDGQLMHASSRPEQVGGYGWSYGKNVVMFCDIERDDPGLQILDSGRKTIQPDFDKLISMAAKEVYKVLTIPDVIGQFWHKEKTVKRVKDKMDMITSALARETLNIEGVKFASIPSNEAEVESIYDQMLGYGHFKTSDTGRFPMIINCDGVAQYDRFAQIELNKTDVGKHAQDDLVAEGYKFNGDGNTMYYPTMEMKPYVSHFTHDTEEKDIADVHVLVAWDDKQPGGNTKNITDDFKLRPITKSEITFPGSTHILTRSDGHKCEVILLREYQGINVKSNEFFKTL